ANHGDYMLTINKGKLEGVYFTSTQPGQTHYTGSAALGGVGEISAGHFPMVMDDRRNGAGSWKNAILATPSAGGIPGARDANADGNHSVAERTIQAMLGTNPITGVFVHQGKNDTVTFKPDSKSKTLVASYNVALVGGTSAACQTPNTSFYYNARTGKNEIFTAADHNFGAGKHGSFNSVENLIQNNPKFGYSVINASDYDNGLMNKLNDLRTNAREELLQKELDKFRSDNPKYKNYDVQFNR
ncbi:TetR family transcriptional regulator, partial [Leptospira weilii serovar Heyan]